MGTSNSSKEERLEWRGGGEEGTVIIPQEGRRQAAALQAEALGSVCQERSVCPALCWVMLQKQEGETHSVASSYCWHEASACRVGWVGERLWSGGWGGVGWGG